jgi:beta-mannosidase
MERYVPWEGDRLAYVRNSQSYQAEVLKHATELFRRREYRPTGGTFAFMLNDPAPAISWSVVDWRRRPKAAYGALADAMRPVLVCARYPDAGYAEGATFSLPVFVVNDLARDLGLLEWTWEVQIDGRPVAGGAAEKEIRADSVTPVGEAETSLAGAGKGTLILGLSGDGVEETNSYDFVVRGRSRPGP